MKFRISVIGGGLVGTATALALAERYSSVVVLEAEKQLAAHQSGHNSGVIHSGLYYKPGSLKARLCVEGARALYRLCEEEGIAHRRCGKVVVATSEEELPRLAELERRGAANGLAGLRRLDAAGIRELEPHAAGIAGLHVPETGIVDYRAVARAYARRIAAHGGEVRTESRLLQVLRRSEGLILETAGGEIACDLLVNCAGLQCDRVAALCGIDPGVRIVPFRGEYYELAPSRSELVRTLIYPVPDPRFPFLGVHFTRGIDGRVEAGPNAVLALKREGYRWSQIAPRDVAATLAWPGFWRFLGGSWRQAVSEVRRSALRSVFLADLRRLIPELEAADLVPGGSGVRAQALDRTGKLLDDFHFATGERSLHVLNAPSPGATASLAIGRRIAHQAAEQLA